MKTSVISLTLLIAVSSLEAADPWPQFRGPNAAGVADEERPPVRFGPETNLQWKVEIPPGLSSPVVFGESIFLTALEDDQLLTIAYDAGTGRELWRRIAPAKQIEACHKLSSPAAPTPCTDGERVYAYFGSFGVLAYDFAGNEVWQRPFERLPIQYGTASSPILAGGNVVLQRDGDSANAQLIALDPETGKTVWETARPLAGACYSTPMVWQHDGVEELMVQGKGRVAAYGLDGSGPHWWVRGWGFTAVTTPVAGDGVLLVGGSGSGDPAEPRDPLFNWDKLLADYDADQDGSLAVEEVPKSLIWHIRKEIPQEVPGNSFAFRFLLGNFMDRNKDKKVTKEEWDAMAEFASDKFNADRFVAVRPGGNEDSTETHVVWETTRGLSEMPSALYYRGRVHLIRDGGLWTVIDAKSGKRFVERKRLGIPGQAVASPVAANGYIYVVSEPGIFAVLRAGDAVDMAAINKLGESVRCTPAIANDTLYVRSATHLWAFREPQPAQP